MKKGRKHENIHYKNIIIGYQKYNLQNFSNFYPIKGKVHKNLAIVGTIITIYIKFVTYHVFSKLIFSLIFDSTETERIFLLRYILFQDL